MSLPEGIQHLKAAEDDMGQAAGASSAASDDAGTMRKAAASISGQLTTVGELVERIPGLRSGVAQKVEGARTSASSAGGHLAQASGNVGTGTVSNLVGAFVATAHEESRLTGTDDLIRQLSEAIKTAGNIALQLAETSQAEQERQTERAGRATQIQQEIGNIASAAAAAASNI